MLKISIIVPVYNTGEYLRGCFDCIIAQTYGNFEVVVVDDGSTDESGGICDEYARKDSRFVVIHKENGGVSTARNRGLDEATGDYVGFADSDDTMLPGMFKEYARVAERTAADLIGTASFLAEGDQPCNRANAHIYEFNNEEARRELFTIGKIRPSVCLAFIKREILSDIRFPSNIHQWEDYAFIACAVARSQKVAITANRYYQYRYREGSATKRLMNERHLSCLLINEFLEEQGVYTNEQERHDVTGFFTRCACVNFLLSTPIEKNPFLERIRKEIKNHRESIKKSRAVPMREKIVVFAFEKSERLSRILLFSERKVVHVLLSLRNSARALMKAE